MTLHILSLDSLEKRVEPCDSKSRITQTKYTLLNLVRLCLPNLFILYQIDLRIEANGVTPMPACLSTRAAGWSRSWQNLHWRTRKACKLSHWVKQGQPLCCWLSSTLHLHTTRPPSRTGGLTYPSTMILGMTCAQGMLSDKHTLPTGSETVVPLPPVCSSSLPFTSAPTAEAKALVQSPMQRICTER